MQMMRLLLMTILVAVASTPGFAQRFAAPRDRSDDYYLRDPSAASPSGANRYRAESSVDLTGTVSSVDRDRESIRLRTSRGLRSIELYDGTHMSFESGRHAGLTDLHAGDELEVRGAERNGRVVAERVTLLGPASARIADEQWTNTRSAVLVGTVRTPTYDVSRRIKVRTAEGDVTVTADPGTPIYGYGDRLSIHDLDQGDRVRVVGRWEGRDRLRASRIDMVLPPPPPRERARGYRSTLKPAPARVVTVVGQLVSYDTSRDRLRLRTRGGDRIVVASGAPVSMRGNPISRGDLRRGDRVRATGYWNGHEILATRVELAY
jgi:uncharacterized protein DUF5666